MRTPGRLDIQAFELINRRATHAVFDLLMPAITHLGLGGVQLPLVGLVWWLHRHDHAGATLGWTALAAFLVSTILVHLVKRRVKRRRPVAYTEVRFLVPVTRHGSFPSGHTATTFALAAVLAWHFPGWTAPLLALATLVGYSRVYVGVHFVSDVAAAGAIGLVSAGAVLAPLIYPTIL
jgi:undecaprenyl-diphosphatase